MRNGTGNSYTREMDAALAESPPEIRWERRNGVMVAIEVHDPHAATAKRAPKAERKPPTNAERRAAVEQWELARLRVVESMRDEADEVAERFRKHRAENTPLMTAARTEI